MGWIISPFACGTHTCIALLEWVRGKTRYAQTIPPPSIQARLYTMIAIKQSEGLSTL